MDDDKTVEIDDKSRGAGLFKVETGNLVRVHCKIVEGKTERIQMFTGIVISKKGVGANEMFTVRKFSFSCGVERIFRKNSPNIVKIEILKEDLTNKKRRSKLFYLRSKIGKAFSNLVK